MFVLHCNGINCIKFAFHCTGRLIVVRVDISYTVLFFISEACLSATFVMLHSSSVLCSFFNCYHICGEYVLS